MKIKSKHKFLDKYNMPELEKETKYRGVGWNEGADRRW